MSVSLVKLAVRPTGPARPLRGPHAHLARRADVARQRAQVALLVAPGHERIVLALATCERLNGLIAAAEHRGLTGSARTLLDEVESAARYAEFEADRSPRGRLIAAAEDLASA